MITPTSLPERAESCAAGKHCEGTHHQPGGWRTGHTRGGAGSHAGGAEFREEEVIEAAVDRLGYVRGRVWPANRMLSVIVAGGLVFSVWLYKILVLHPDFWIL